MLNLYKLGDNKEDNDAKKSCPPPSKLPGLISCKKNQSGYDYSDKTDKLFDEFIIHRIILIIASISHFAKRVLDTKKSETTWPLILGCLSSYFFHLCQVTKSGLAKKIEE